MNKLSIPYDPFSEMIKFLKKQNANAFKIPSYQPKLPKIKKLPSSWKILPYSTKKRDPFKALLKKYTDNTYASIKKQMRDYLNPKPLRKKRKIDPVTKYLNSLFGDTYDDNYYF